MAARRRRPGRGQAGVRDEAGAGLVGPHWLRRTRLVTQNDITVDLRSVQHFAGHSPETMGGYTWASRRRLQSLVDTLDYRAA